MGSVGDRDRVVGIENKIVLTGKLTAGGDADAEELAGAIDFELFDGTGENLLVNGGGEVDAVAVVRRFRGELNGFGAQGKKCGAVWFASGPAQRAAGGDALAHFGAEEIGLADELSGIAGGGAGIDFARRSDLFEGAVFE